MSKIKFIEFYSRARKELKWYQKNNKILYEKVITLIENIKLDPYNGLGKPEALKFALSGYWSRRINREHRLVYKISGNKVIIVSCKFHY